MSIDVDLDRPPVPADPGGWLDRPKRVVAVVATAGVLLIAVAAVSAPAWRAAPAPAAAPAAVTCPAGVPPLPAFAVTLPVAGDLYEYEDTGRWAWHQMVWIPSSLDGGDVRLIELQTQGGGLNTITIGLSGPHLTAQVHDLAGVVTHEARLDFAPAMVFGQWSELRVTSTDVEGSDVLAVSLTDVEGATAAGALPVTSAFHAPLAGFSVFTPLGSAAEPEIKYGPPVFTTQAC